MSEINRKMAHGAGWMVVLRLSVRGLSVVSTIILARLLVPGDFGLVAMATSVVALLELVTAFNFDVPLIQKQNATKDHFSTAWTLNIFLHAGLCGVLVLIAEPIAAFYQDGRLPVIIYALAVAYLITGFENTGIVNFRKDLDFRRDVIFLVAKKMTGFVITIPLAFIFRSYWALVAGIVGGKIGGVLLSYMLHSFRPTFSIANAREMITFSKWLVANNAIAFARTRSPDFVIGRILGAASLGLFTLAYEISRLPTAELAAPINRVVFPGYSKMSGDRHQLGQSYLGVLGFVALIVLPAGIGISLVSEPLVKLMLGSKWSDAAPVLAILACSGAITATQANNSSLYYALGKPYLITVLGSAYSLLLVSLSVAFVFRWGIVGVAMSYLCTAVVFTPVSFFVVGRELAISSMDFASALWRPVVSCGVMYIAVSYVQGLLEASVRPESIAALGVLVVTGFIFYLATLLLLWYLMGKPQGAEQRVINFVFRRMKRQAPIQNLER